MKETSLDDFRDASGDGDAADADPDVGTDETVDGGAENAGDAGQAAGDQRPDSPTVTAAWSPGGDPCGACGETVHRRWRDGDALVCRACTDW